MKDKVQAIRNEIERLYKEWDEHGDYDRYYRGMADGLDVLEQFIDSLQDDDESSTVDRVRAILDEIENRLNTCIKRLDAAGDDYSRTLEFGVRRALIDLKDFIDSSMAEPKPMCFNSVLRLIANIEPTKSAIYYANVFAGALEKEGYEKDASLVRNQIKMWRGEDVAIATQDKNGTSSDLAEEINAIHERYPEVSFAKLSRIAKHFATYGHTKGYKAAKEECLDPYNKGFENGKGWQKKQDEKELSEKIAAAYQLGLSNQKEQMMKGAVVAIVNTYEELESGDSCVEFVADISASKFRKTDSVKLIILKDDESTR